MNPLLRNTLIVLGCAFLILFETSFWASLPTPLAYLPITFAVCVYLIQSRNWWPACWLMIVFGATLDLLGISPVPAQTVAYAAAAFAAYASSRMLFSNRSLYGILGCGLLAWAAQTIVQTILWVTVQLVGAHSLAFGAYASWMVWRLALMLIVLTVLFYGIPRRNRLALI